MSESLERARREVDAYLTDSAQDDLAAIQLVIQLAQIDQLARIANAIEGCCERLSAQNDRAARMSQVFDRVLTTITESANQ